MKFKCFLFILLSNLIIQQNAQSQPPPNPECSNYAGVDVFPFYGTEICGDYGAFVDLFIITNGPPIGEFYDIIISGTDGSQGFGFGDDGGFGFAELFPDPVEGCEPVEVSFEMIIICPYTGEELDLVDLGTFTVYPQLFVDVVEPGCGEGENGSATLVAMNGEICDGPIEGVAGIDGDCETQQPGTLTYDFNPFPDALYCFFNFSDAIEVPCTELEFGCIDAAACNYSETAVCDDGSCVFEEPCCPRPLVDGIPTGLCGGGYYPDSNFCLTFDGDITAIDIYGINLFSANGGFGFPVSNDPATNEICFVLDFFYNYYDFCQPFEDNIILEYNCYDTGEFVSVDLGTITIYPPPFAFQVFSTPAPECGVPPVVFPPECGELVIGEIVDPINDCDNLTPGTLFYDIDPGFDLTNAPDCFTAILAGEIPIPACEEGCPCDGTFCGGTCTDLMITSDGLPQTVCTYGGDPITVEITGQGATTATYFGNIFSNGIQVGGFFHQPGDPTTFDIFPFFYGPNTICEPVTYPLEYEIFCAADGALIASGVLGDITLFPEPFFFFPEIIEGQPCGAGATILPAPCGTVITDPEPIPNPQCGEGADDQIVTWTVDLGFDPADAPDCFDESFLTGEFIVFGCPDNPGDPCFLECLGEGTLDENCNCAVEGAPQLEISGDPPVAACQGEPFQVDVNLIGMIPPGQGYGIEVFDQNGNGINFIPVDSYTVFPLTIDLFDFTYYDPCVTREVTYTFILRCFYDFSIIGTPLVVGPITIYPSPFNYTPFIDPAIPCESEPTINLFGYCPATLEILETVPPVDDCDAPQAGYVSWQIVPPFDITNAPACFTDPLMGQAPIPPCLIDCPCDGTFCQGVCVDLMATASDLPAEVCPDYGFQYQLDITGLGADFGNYFILTFDNNGFNIGFDVHNPGDPTTLFPFIFPFVQGCEPEEQTFTYEIQCPDDGSILASGTIGTVLVYPSPFNFFPNITPSIACVQDLTITPAPCGTLILDPDPIPVPGCGGEDSEVSWSVDFGFEYPPDCYTFPIEGIEPVFACDGTPGDPCDDGNPCTDNDTLDENCSCIGDGPTVTFDSVLPEAACSNEPVDVTVTVDMIPADGLFVIITDQAGNFFGFFQLLPGDPLTNTFQFFPFTYSICAPTLFNLQIELLCPFYYNTIGVAIPIGSLTVYPPLDVFIPVIEPAILCGEEPVISPPACGDLVLDVTPADAVACPAGNDGFVEWTVDPGFDVSAAPDCFDTTEFSGQEPILACSNCCPLVVDVTIADEGPFCSGDMTEVCATFDVPFETDAQVTINGVDAVAGEDQICFQLDLVNDGCSYEPVQVPFEIICNDDGTVSNALSPDVLVAPDPSNFQYQVTPGGCGFPPFVGAAPDSPCFVFSGYPPTIITDPVDGCPPVDGQIEIPLDYFDENFNPIDVTAFGCDGFDATLLLPQPGCSTCDCPNPPVNVTVTEDACEGSMLEICIEFEAGDEANAIGTQINIFGESGTFANATISGDGMSTTYCTEFNLNAFIDCDPFTENLTIDLFCASDGSPLFNGMAITTIYPALDKFTYEVTPAVDNCPDVADYPAVISTGDCDLDIINVAIVDPVDGCPPTAGSLTYSVNYIDPTLFANAPAECLFAPVIDAVEPIPACDTCTPDECTITPDMAANILCDDNGTPDDGSDDTFTFDITVNGSNTAAGASNTFNDDQGNAGIAYGSSVSYGPFPISGGNITVTFTDVDDSSCTATMMAAAPPTCSDNDPCEDEISGTVIPPMGCNVSGITVTIYDAMGNVVTTLTTDANGVYDSTPTVYPCGNYTAELTANIPTCYSDANGETGPKPFTIDDDPDNSDTDGTDFEGVPVVCEDEISGTVIPPAGCTVAGITVTIYDDMGNVVTTLATDANGVYDSTPTVYPCGDYTAELTANIPTCYSDANGETGPKPFTIDDDPDNNDTDGTDFEGVPVVCEDEISGTVIPPASCSVAGVTVTIYDDMGNVVTTLTTDANGVYDSTPTVYPCGDYTSELTANLPACYTDANGETGPKPFVIDDDPNNNDTDGTDFMAEEQSCSISVEISQIICDNNETPEDGSDDIVTITVTVTSTGPWTAGDGTTGNDGDTYSFPATPANDVVSMMFSVDGEIDCETVFTSILNDCEMPAIPTLSQWGLILMALLLMTFGALKMFAINYSARKI